MVGVGVDIIAVVMGAAIVLLALFGIIFLGALKILKGGGKHSRRGIDPEEAKLMQEIYQGLQKMEDRVESLETLLIEQSKMREEHARMKKFADLEDENV